jgi:hypothetical protein
MRKSGAPVKVNGSYSDSPVIGNASALMLSGPAGTLPAGRYIVVYRIYSAQQFAGDDVCTLQATSNNTVLASYHVADRELSSRDWSEIPLDLTLKAQAAVQLEFSPNKHVLAVDRIYVLEVR